MDAAIIGRIALETAIPESSVAAAAALFERGATGPFIVHYRKEDTGGLDEAKIRSIQERIAYYKEIWDQRAVLLKMMSEQEKLTEELQKRIENCYSKGELDDLHHQFRPRRKTRAIDAAEKGLEPLAEYFWNQELDAWSVEEHIDVFVDPAKGISTREQALQGIVDIIAEWIWGNIEYRKALRDMLWSEGALISSVVPAKVGQKTKYNMYYDRRESVTTIPSHRVLAIRRGCKEGILISSIEGDNSKALEFLLDSIIKDKESIFAPVLEAAVRESYNRLLRPLIETEVRTQLKERADREAIKVFQENLANLLLSPPAGPIVVMGIDYGKGDECNVTIIDETGKFLEGAKIRFASASKNKSAKGKKGPPLPSPDSGSKEAETQPETENSAPAQEQSSETSSTEAVSPDPSAPDASGSEASSKKTEQEPEAPSADPEPNKVKTQPEADNSAPVQEQSAESPSSETASSEPSALEDGKEKSSGQPLQAEANENPPIADRAVMADPPATEPLNAPDLSLVPQTPGAEAELGETSQAESSTTTAEATAAESPDTPAAEAVSTAAENETEQSQPIGIENDPATTDAASTESLEKSTPDGTPPVEETAEGIPVTTEGALETTEGAPEIIEGAPETAGSAPEPEPEIEDPAAVLKALIAKHNIKAISVGIGAGSRELETTLRQIVQEDGLSDIIIAAVNDAGIAIYSSSRIAREEFPDWSASARCAVSLARRLQDPLAELVKIDPKLIGVGQYQHDVDQKALHRGLLQTVQYCVNKVGVNVNTASESLLRYVSGLNDKLARRLVAYRTSQGPFRSRDSIMAAVGMDEFTYQQAAAFLRIPDGENVLDRTAIHPESYPAVEKMAAALEVEIDKLIGNKELISSLNLEDFLTETTGAATLADIREELLRPGRDPRKTFRVPKFRADVKEMTDLKPGMALEGTVTNVTNFGAFVDIGVRQDGLVHLSQMSNRFIRDPREAVKVGDVVQVKVISIEPETKRIGLSMKAMLPTAQRRRKKQRRNARRQGSQSEGKSGGSNATGDTGSGKHSKSNRSHQGSSRNRRRGGRKQGNPEASQQKESDTKIPEPTLQEKIAILQSKFRRIK